MKMQGYSTIVFFMVLLGPFILRAQTDKEQTQIIMEEDGDVQLRIDFTSGSQIINEPPVLKKTLPDIVMIEGDTTLKTSPLSNYFDDPENGSRLTYEILLSDSSLLSAKLIKDSQHMEVIPRAGKSGKATVIVSASDDILHVKDTFEVHIKKKLLHKRNIGDITVRKGQKTAHTIKLNRLFDKTYSYSDYTYQITVSDSALLSPTINTEKGRLSFLIADSLSGVCDVKISISDPDSQMITDSFTVSVIKRSYDVEFDPGISLFTGLDYSGLESRFWIKNIIGFGVGVYTIWDMEGLGGEISLRGKLPLNGKVAPYINISGGYHFQKVPKFQSNSQALTEVSFLTFSGALGAEVRPGKSGLHGISFEAGYRYGTADFYHTSLIDPTIQDESLKETFTMDPLLLKLIYTFYFRGISNKKSLR